MASVHFVLRSKILEKESTIFLRFRDKELDIKIPLRNLSCKPKNWKDGKCKNPSLKMHNSDDCSINVTLSKIEEKIIYEYRNTPNKGIEIKNWLIDTLYGSELKVEENVNNDDLFIMIDKFIDSKKDTLANSSILRYKGTKTRLEKYAIFKGYLVNNVNYLKFSDLNNEFKEDYINYSKSLSYQISTIYKDLKIIKGFVKIAENYDIKVDKQTASWKFNMDKVTSRNPKSIYLSHKELQIIEDASMPEDYLDNARDWLLIACNTGQRVSDYLRFEKSMIIHDSDGTQFLEFVQKKTDLKMRLPLLKKIKQILEKRDGNFPRKISDVKLNKYIKKVCEIAKIDEIIENGVVMKVEREDGTEITRKINGQYRKYELVTSHIGRKSFATNYYEHIPTPNLMIFTGHSTERQLLEYINKTDIERAKATAEIFSRLGY